jgi:hypothetical protein
MAGWDEAPCMAALRKPGFIREGRLKLLLFPPFDLTDPVLDQRAISTSYNLYIRAPGPLKVGPIGKRATMNDPPFLSSLDAH